MNRYSVVRISVSKFHLLDAKHNGAVAAVVFLKTDVRGTGWLLNPNSSARTMSRKLHASPAAAIASAKYMTIAQAQQAVADAKDGVSTPEKPSPVAAIVARPPVEGAVRVTTLTSDGPLTLTSDGPSTVDEARDGLLERVALSVMYLMRGVEHGRDSPMAKLLDQALTDFNTLKKAA